MSAAPPPATVPTSQPAANGVTVNGAVGRSQSWSGDDLRSRFAAELKPVGYDSHGKHHTARAVSLLAVLQAAGVDATLKMDPKVDSRTKNVPLRMAVVVRGRDGYTATFALAELLPDIGDRPVWLAVDADDHPLRDPAAPAELLSPADAKPGRWVRGVATITVVDPTR